MRLCDGAAAVCREKSVTQERGHVFAPPWDATLGRGAAASVGANHHRLVVRITLVVEVVWLRGAVQM